MKRIQFIILLLALTLTSFSYAQAKYDMVVALDGSGDFTSLQAAINATKAFPPQRITIFIKNGTYHEKVNVYSWNTDLTLIGESAENTIISYDDSFNKINLGRNSTFHTWTMKVEANNFKAENLTIENTAGPVGQAVALHVEADCCVFRNVKILGNQDALYAAGMNCHQYYKDCYIEGTTDFIFGAATALFENCIIHSKSNSYITAASTPEGVEFGYVFKECKLTAAENIHAVYLGRPWRKYAKTVFIECELGSHIVAEGWKEWSNSDDHSTTFYAEYKNIGPGADLTKRITWSHQLSKKEFKKYSIENILQSESNKNENNWKNIIH
ncbi:MAG: pectinesterase family protein [Prolixibacteraceae bacterium]